MALKKYDIIRLHFNGPVHLGGQRTDSYDVSEKILHSDTIKGALYAVAVRLLGAEALQGEAFLQSFRISSAYPFFNKQYFFPKPMMRLPLRPDGVAGENEIAKELKKIEFIGKGFFEAMIEAGPEAEIVYQAENLSSTSRFLWDSVAPEEVLFKSETGQRVQITRNQNAAKETESLPFYMERIHFHPKAGLFVLLEMEDEERLDLVKQAFRFLGEEGVGTDRSVGYGFFTPQFDELELKLPESPNALMALGLFNPASALLTEEFLDKSSYLLMERGGYIAGGEDEHFRHFRKRNLRVFTEGSVFPHLPGLCGRIVDTRPESQAIAHPVYRDANPLFIPINA